MTVGKDELRWLKKRQQQAGDEIEKDRPWMVLSNAKVHHNELFIASASTTTPDPGRQFYLQPYATTPPTAPPVDPSKPDGAKEITKIDTQQVWTFPFDRVKTGSQRALVDNPKDVRARVRRHLEESKSTYESGSPQAAGNIVWLNLAAPSNIKNSDQQAMSTFFAKVTGEQWPYAATRLPSVIIANNINAPADPTPLSLITVVPLVYSPAVLQKYEENPTVELYLDVPGVKTLGHPIQFTLCALTQLLLTVDYRAAQQHVSTSDAGLRGLRATRAELEAIVTNVVELLGGAANE